MLKKYGFTFIKLEISRTLQIKRLKETHPHRYREHMERLDHESELYIHHLEKDKTFIITEELEDNIIDCIIKEN